MQAVTALQPLPLGQDALGYGVLALVSQGDAVFYLSAGAKELRMNAVHLIPARLHTGAGPMEKLLVSFLSVGRRVHKGVHPSTCCLC